MKYEITSKKEFQIEAAKALLADGQPHSYAEIVQHIRSQAEGTVLEGRIDYGTPEEALESRSALQAFQNGDPNFLEVPETEMGPEMG